MKLTGSFAQLALLRANLKRAATPEMRIGLARAVGEAARTQLALGFRQSVDPYGAAWLPLKHRKGKPLLDTGRMRNSFTYTPTPNGISIGSNVKYAPFHQYGTNGRKKAGGRSQAIDDNGRFLSHRKAGVKRNKGFQRLYYGFRRLNFSVGSGKIPQRMMLPVADRGLGNWGPPLRAAAQRYVARTLRGR